MSRIWILGGYQTDFARNVSREGGSLASLLRDNPGSGLTCASFVVGRA